MSYRKLQIWVLAREIAIEVHVMSLKLPKFELYEEGSQIRRSSKTTKSAIVEGYGRRRYKQEWIKFLVYALSSNDESMDHLENLWDTKSLTDEPTYTTLKNKIESLGKMLNKFLQSVEQEHQSPKYMLPTSSTKYPASSIYPKPAPMAHQKESKNSALE